VLGCYLLSTYGNDLLGSYGITASVAFYVIRYPALSLIVGLWQIMNSIWGLARWRGMLVQGDRAGVFQKSIWFGWLLQVTMQIMTQPASVPGAAANSAVVAAFCFGQNLMPAYLDAKVRSIPESISPGYYGSAEEGGQPQEGAATGDEEKGE